MKYLTTFLIVFFFILLIGGNLLIVLGYNTSLTEISQRVSLDTKISAYKNYSSEPDTGYVNLSGGFEALGKAIILENLNFKSLSINSISGKYESNYLNLTLDTTLFLSFTDINIKFLNTIVTLKADSITIIEENTIYVVKGNIKYDSTIVETGYQISNISNQLSVYKSDRELFNGEDYSSFIEMLKNFELYSDYFTDFTFPKLLSLTPRDNFKTTDSFLNIAGTTEENVKVFLNDLEFTTTTDGAFNFRIDLTLGDNLFKLTLRDKYLNEEVINLKYIRKSIGLTPISNVISYPNSYPLSYNN